MSANLRPAVDYPVDLVYLWVDGSEPMWLARKQQFLSSMDPGKIEHRGAVQERWHDNDELRHSLRSVEMFAPWVRHVYLVTDDQYPPWLKRDHPRVSVISTQEIFPPGVLPVFNSDAIETRLPFIPGLAEHFLYANDDMFFGRHTPAEFFFTPAGRPIVQVKPIRGLAEHLRAGKFEEFVEPLKTQGNLFRVCRMIKILHEVMGEILPYQDAHVIDPYCKSQLLANLSDRRFRELWEMTTRSRFRSQDTAQRGLHTLIDHAAGRNQIRDISKFKRLRRLLSPHRMPMLLCKPGDFAKIEKIRPYLFCVFDNQENRRLLPEFFARYYPRKSSFEI